MRFSVYQESRIGGRSSNQDRMGYCYTRDALLILLADGMGGHAGGEIAADIAMKTLGACFHQGARPRIASPQRFLEDSFFAAHREILRYCTDQHLDESPRTTIVACLVQDGVAIWAHCGDSRLYWMREGAVLTRTRDHSNIENLIAQGRVLPSERATHPERNRLHNCLGAPIAPKVEISRPAMLQTGDLLLLCSDGLWATVPEPILARELFAHSIVQAVPALVQKATEIGGKYGDNVTALAMSWDGSGNLEGAGQPNADALRKAQEEIAMAEDFSESEIEKAIAEIRAAIERTGRLPRRS
ncbi:MAG: PP2C family protein-serine/threonine phosphatase [Janthinobacterium lividum]